MSWKEEIFFNSGDEYYRDLIQGIDRARKRVRFETYIYEKGKTGDAVIEALLRAQARGCQVTLLVDAIGSPTFVNEYGNRLAQERLLYRTYHPAPWGRFTSLRNWLKRFQWVNRRNHRKACVVDGKTAWIGSLNVSDSHSESIKGKDSWRDNSVRVTGAEVRSLDREMEATFFQSRRRGWSPHRLRNLRLNSTLIARRHLLNDFLDRINQAQRRVWIVTPYFVPHGVVLRAIRRAALQGKDVRLVIPLRSDVPFIRWVALTFCAQLIRRGVRIFEYTPRVLHAKTVLFDETAILGSTNLNHRSFQHDLEVDVLLEKAETIQAIETQFKWDIVRSHELTLEKLEGTALWQRVLGSILVFFRSIL